MKSCMCGWRRPSPYWRRPTPPSARSPASAASNAIAPLTPSFAPASTCPCGTGESETPDSCSLFSLQRLRPRRFAKPPRLPRANFYTSRFTKRPNYPVPIPARPPRLSRAISPLGACPLAFGISSRERSSKSPHCHREPSRRQHSQPIVKNPLQPSHPASSLNILSAL